MDNVITQLGVGGILAFLIVKEVLNFAAGKQSSNGSVSRREFEEHKSKVQYRDNCNEIVKRLDGNHASQEKRFDTIDCKLETLESLIRNGGRE